MRCRSVLPSTSELPRLGALVYDGGMSVLILGAFLSLVGCKSDTDTAVPADDVGTTDCTEEELAYALSWDSWGATFFSTYCDSCHAADTPNRYDAPEGVSFDTPDEVLSWADRIEARVIDEQDMPPGGGVYADDLFLLEIFMACGLEQR